MNLSSTAIFREGVKGKQRPFGLQLCASHGRTFAWHFLCGVIDSENAPQCLSVCDVRHIRHGSRAYFEIKTSRRNSAWSACISSFVNMLTFFIRFKGHVMHKTFIIGSIFNVPLQTKTAFLGPLSVSMWFSSLRYHREETAVLSVSIIERKHVAVLSVSMCFSSVRYQWMPPSYDT